MKILAIADSTRKNSYNLALLEAIKIHSPKNTSVSIFQNIDDIPLFSADVTDEKQPKAVQQLALEIRSADAIVISTPEYAHGIPGALKNALDWLVSSDALTLKPVVVTSVSTSSLGGIRAHAPLQLILSAMNANVVVEGSITLPFAHRKFDEQAQLTDTLTIKAIEVLFLAIRQALT